MYGLLLIATAYFDRSFEHSIGLVQKGVLEGQILTLGANRVDMSEDPATYAVRNAVYAIGSRYDGCADEDPAHYAATQATSWSYLENAMSVFTELLFLRSKTLAVEALLLMVLPLHGKSFATRFV